MKKPIIGFLLFVLVSSAPALVPPARKQLPNFSKQQRADQDLPDRKAAVANLKAMLPEARADFYDVTGSPRLITAQHGFLTGPNGEGRTVSAKVANSIANDPYRETKAFITEHQKLFGHGVEVLNAARITRDYTGKHNGLHTVVWQQQLDGIDIYQAVFISHTTKHGELARISSQFVADSVQAANNGTPNRAARIQSPAIDAKNAVIRAAQNLGEPVSSDELSSINDAIGADKKQSFKVARFNDSCDVNLVWLPLNQTALKLCWSVSITSRQRGESYVFIVDAQSGEILVRRCLTDYLTDATFDVFTGDSPTPFSPGYTSPDTTQPATVSRVLITTNAFDTNASPAGWIADADNETRGNNVDAHLDRDNDNQPDLPRPQGSPFRVFDFPIDFSQSPTTYQPAAVTQLFFLCNWYHDRLYNLGFTEAAGNFQNDNFGRGGVGGDAVLADAQDGGGTQNANFATPPDGKPGRMQMYLFNQITPNRDGDLDAEVVFHEHTHGVSNRRVGGGVGISAAQPSGMGEGWSDFYALSLLSDPADDANGCYAMGGYVTDVSAFANYYYGIRRYPYTTDITKNPLTFKDLDSTQASPHTGVQQNNYWTGTEANEVHNQGEVWCVTLWQARANLIAKYGGAIGNERMLQLVTDAMPLCPPDPTYVESRDAILQADEIDYNGNDLTDLWSAFAKRGMGVNAYCPPNINTIGIVESFNAPGDMFITPTKMFNVIGTVGGALSFSNQTFTVSNSSGAPLTWTVTHSNAWYDLSTSGGTLAPGAATNFNLTLKSTASQQSTGEYFDNVTFANTTLGTSMTVPVRLRLSTVATLPFSEGWESGSFAPYWLVTGSQSHRSQVTPFNSPHSGSYHMTMDASGANYSINEVTLHLNLANYTNVLLHFFAREYGDEANYPSATPVYDRDDYDGVAISTDGYNWYVIQSLRDLKSFYTGLDLNLDPFMQMYGLSYGSNFYIRFNQYDNSAITSDGIAIDDISVTGRQQGVLDHFDLSPITSPQTSNAPFLVSIAAKDGFNTTITNFTTNVTLTALSGPTNTVPFSDNFEDGSIADWSFGGGTYTRAAVNDTAAGGNYSVTLIGGSQVNYNGIQHDFASSQPDSISFWVKNSRADKAGGYVTIGSGSSIGIFFFMGNDGYMAVYEPAQGNHGYPYTSNTWYHMTFAVDWSNQQVDWYVNGVMQEANIPFDVAVGSFSRIYLFNYNNTQAWWDEISFSQRNTSFASLPVFPPSSGSFQNGVWSGYVSVSGASSSVALKATAGAIIGQGNTFQLLADPDTNGNGLPDSWETANGVTDPNDDPDHDGLTNLQEYRAGTDPKIANSALRIISSNIVGSQLQINFKSVATRYYRLERADDLSLPQPVWTTVADYVPGNGSTVQIVDTYSVAQPRRFYRLRVLP